MHGLRLQVFLFLVGCVYASIDYASGEAFQKPSLDPPQVIGFYSAGCLAGARALPLRGRGFTVMRPSRNRFYSHPHTIDLVQRLGRFAADQGNTLLIGDLSQPRGGPMPYGHRSHQSGLDVDIWYQQLSHSEHLSQWEIETLPMLSMVNAAQGTLRRDRWSAHHRDILKYAAETPEVQRIFVNPIIKRFLCVHERQDRGWLQKIRPWWGHDSHFHVRLRCPENSSQCESQKPPPNGDGCQEKNMRQWIQEIRQAALRPSPKPRSPISTPITLPPDCNTVLHDSAIR